MACILKLPHAEAKGVVTFTTQERDHAIFKRHVLRKAVEDLKTRWVVGLHHNWHDHRFSYDPLFDFSMAGEGDLVEVSGRDVPRIGLDACNFAPSCFRPSRGEPFWDILYVARPAFFKGLPQFLQAIRTLYDRGLEYRVLCLTPMPPYDRRQRKTVFYDVRKVYEGMFTGDEQDLFTLLTMDFRYPFPLDLPTLAHFYRSSRAFAHFGDDERRCRVAGYAWASGMPVIGRSCVASIIPPELRRPPYFYEARDYSEFPDRIVEAVEVARCSPQVIPSEARQHVSEEFTRETLRGEIAEQFPETAPGDNTAYYALERLDIRLGRHVGLDSGSNAVELPLETFTALLREEGEVVAEAVRTSPDPEKWLAASQKRPIQRGRLLGWAVR